MPFLSCRIDIPSSLSPLAGRGGRQLCRVLPAGAQLGAADPRRADPRPRPRVGASHRTSVSHFTQFSFQMSFKQHLQKKRRPRRRLTDKPPSSPHLLAGIIDFFCGRLVYIRRGDEEEDDDEGRSDPPSFLPPLSLPNYHPIIPSTSKDVRPLPRPFRRQMTLTFAFRSCGGDGKKGRKESALQRTERREREVRSDASAKKRPQSERRERAIEDMEGTWKHSVFLRIHRREDQTGPDDPPDRLDRD